MAAITKELDLKSAVEYHYGQFPPATIDYGKLIGQLSHENYSRALAVHVPPIEGYDHRAELRKIRLLLESLL